MELRGRKRKSSDLANKILEELQKSRHKNGVGSRELFSKLDPGSKFTLTSTLKLLTSQNKIEKNSAGKYTITPTFGLDSNIDGLRELLEKMNKIIPELKPEQHAYIGIKLWTMIFQNEFHPVKMFMHDAPYFRISNDVSKRTRENAVKEYFESHKHPSMFEYDMYSLFFDFCARFSSSVLDKVFNKMFNPKQNKHRSKNRDTRLALLFKKEIFIIHDLAYTFYGKEFYEILLEEKLDVFNNDILQSLKEKNIFQKSTLVSIDNL